MTMREWRRRRIERRLDRVERRIAFLQKHADWDPSWGRFLPDTQRRLAVELARLNAKRTVLRAQVGPSRRLLRDASGVGQAVRDGIAAADIHRWSEQRTAEQVARDVAVYGRCHCGAARTVKPMIGGMRLVCPREEAGGPGEWSGRP